MTSYPTSRSGLAAFLVTATLGRQPVIAVPTVFILLLGDCTAATFLAQCCYLSEKSTDPAGWFEYAHDAWRSELGLSPDQVRRCVRDCAGMVEVRKMGLPARNFYRISQDGIRARLATLQLPSTDPVTTSATERPEATPGPRLSRSSSNQLAQSAVAGSSRSPARRQTPQHSSVVQKKEQRINSSAPGTDDVQSTPPISTDALTRLLSVWNAHRGQLPEASGLNAQRRKALAILLADCGSDVEQAAELLTDAAREVAADEFWTARRFALDTLLPRVLGKAESWRSRHPNAGQTPNRPAPLSFGIGQLVLYRRERYAIEAMTERYVDLWDEKNGSARILLNSDDIRALRPLEVRA